VLANKQDIGGAQSAAEIREARHASCPILRYAPLTRPQALDLDGIKSHTWRIMSCSAVTGHNLVAGLDWVVGDVAGRLYYSSTVSPLEPRGEPATGAAVEEQRAPGITA
jgi:ADP-ribosylation factor-like protein 2